MEETAPGLRKMRRPIGGNIELNGGVFMKIAELCLCSLRTYAFSYPSNFMYNFGLLKFSVIVDIFLLEK